MKELSVGASRAWRIAASEAAAAKHQCIEKEHILIGICSLEKVLRRGGAEFDLQGQQLLQVENNRVEDVLRAFELDATQLRGQVRERLGVGSYRRTEKVVHRSEACKRFFERADELASPTEEITCLHLLPAILEDPGITISSALDEAGVKLSDLRGHALAYAAKKQEPPKESVEIKHGEPNAAQVGTHYLDRYGRDLTREAAEGKTRPLHWPPRGTPPGDSNPCSQDQEQPGACR